MWIPEVAGRGWLIITRVSHIQDHRAEIAAVRDNDAKLVALASADAKSNAHRAVGQERWPIHMASQSIGLSKVELN